MFIANKSNVDLGLIVSQFGSLFGVILSEVLKLGNPGQINERCLELQKNEKGNVSKMKV